MLTIRGKNLDTHKMDALIVLTSYLSSHCPLLDVWSHLPTDITASQFSMCSTRMNIFLFAFPYLSDLLCSWPTERSPKVTGAENICSPSKDTTCTQKMYICFILLVVLINGRIVGRLRGNSNKREGGNITVDEVCSINKLTFRNTCCLALIASALCFS